MSNRLIGFVMAGVLMMIWGGIGELATMSDTQMARLNALMQMPVTKDAGFFGFMTIWANFAGNWVSTLWGMLWMQFGFYGGDFSIFYLIFWLPVAVAVIYGLVALLRGVRA